MKKKVLILVNHDVTVYAFRLELVERLLAEGHQVVISTPFGDYADKLQAMGCECRPIEIDRHGMNPAKDLKLLLQYVKLIRQVRPDMVFTYTIKPNVYGGLACRLTNTPYVINITGLGTAVEGGGWKQNVVLLLYKLGSRKAQRVFFQNANNRDFMLRHGVSGKAIGLLPGSGVNLKQHCLEPYPADDGSGKLLFLIIGRLMKDKGTDEVLYAARKIKAEYPNAVFRFLGFYDGNYEEKIRAAVAEGIVEHLGQVADVHAQIRESHATIHASYHEGMANVLLETAACGRPVIATDIPGCREAFLDGVSGLSCRSRDAESLVCAIRHFIQLPHEDKARMGLAGREKMEREFNRQIVVEHYLNELSDTGVNEYESVRETC